MKNWKIIVPIAVILVIGIAIGAFFLFDDKEEKEESPTPPVVTEELTTVVISINPKLALEIDKDKNVKNMYPLNDDAKEFDREKYIGKTLDESIETVLEDASKFLKKDKNITISIAEGETIKLDEIEKIIQEKNEELIIKKEELTESAKEDIMAQVNQIKEEDKTTDEEKEDGNQEEPGKESEEVVEVVKSSNANLSSLSVDKIDLAFQKGTTSYKGLVEYAVSSVKITAKAEDSKAKVSGTGSKNLSVGTNSLKVTVTAENGTTKTYTIAIERRAEFNLSDATEYMLMSGVNTPSYVYPNNEVCFGKSPSDIDIPEGQTYDEYCQNKVPTEYPKISGAGYHCQPTDSPAFSMSEEGITASTPYVCQWIDEIADENKFIKEINKILQVGNYFELGGGMGGGDPITLTEDICSEFNITCGRW